MKLFATWPTRGQAEKQVKALKDKGYKAIIKKHTEANRLYQVIEFRVWAVSQVWNNDDN